MTLYPDVPWCCTMTFGITSPTICLSSIEHLNTLETGEMDCIQLRGHHTTPPHHPAILPRHTIATPPHHLFLQPIDPCFCNLSRGSLAYCWYPQTAKNTDDKELAYMEDWSGTETNIVTWVHMQTDTQIHWIVIQMIKWQLVHWTVLIVHNLIGFAICVIRPYVIRPYI